MALTEVGDTSSSKLDTAARLRLDVYDPIAKAMGYPTVTAQAAWHDLSRSQMHALRAGENIPRLDTAMQIAADCGVPVEALFGAAA